jgi:hypothetical protein
VLWWSTDLCSCRATRRGFTDAETQRTCSTTIAAGAAVEASTKLWFDSGSMGRVGACGTTLPWSCCSPFCNATCSTDDAGPPEPNYAWRS